MWTYEDGIEVIDSIDEAINSGVSVEKFRAKAKELEAERLELIEQGIYGGGWWWKGGKYLYKQYTDDTTGKKIRKYIGSKPEAVEAALLEGERYKRVSQIESELNELRRLLARARNRIIDYVYLIHGEQRKMF